MELISAPNRCVEYEDLRLASDLLAASAMVLSMPASGFAATQVLENWEGLADADPFDGMGNRTWVGDTSAFEVFRADWPSGVGADKQDFGSATERALRSSHASNLGPNTVLTDITSELDASKPLEWSVYIAGNSAEITTSKRVDFILAANTSDVATVEAPDASLLGYKLAVWDPRAAGDDSHEALAFSDSIVLWKSTGSDDRWVMVGGSQVGPINLRDGWNLRVSRSTSGQWAVAASNAPEGTVALPLFDVSDASIDLSQGTWFSGVSWLTTATDASDFGFDEFSFIAVPEPLSGSSLFVTAMWIGVRRRGL